MDIEFGANSTLDMKCYFNINEANNILGETFPDFDKTYSQRIIDNLKQMIKNSVTDKNGTYVNIIYNRKKTGRYYIAKYGLQSLSSGLRGRLVNGIVQDVDIVNCAPSILLYLAKKYKLDHDNLSEYIKNRDHYLNDLMTSIQIKRSDAKNVIISLINGGNINMLLNGKILPSWLIKLNNEITTMINALYNKTDDVFFNYIKESIKRKRKDDEYQGIKKANTLGSFIAHTIFTIENTILMKAYNYMYSNGFYVNDLIFDGLYINTKLSGKCVDDRILYELSNYIKKEIDIDITFSVKPLEYLYGNKILPKQVNKYITINGVEYIGDKYDWLYEPVKNDYEACVKFLEIYKNEIIYCKSILYSYNSSTGYWTDNEVNISNKFIAIRDFLHIVDRNGNKSTKSYGSSCGLTGQIYKYLKALTIDDKWVSKISLSSLYKLLFKNGIWDFKLKKLIPFNKNIVFFSYIDDDWVDNDDIKKYAAIVKEKLFCNIFDSKLNPDSTTIREYMIAMYARALAGDIYAKHFFVLIGMSNAGKGVLTAAYLAGFEGFAHVFDADALKFNDASDVSTRTRWALSLRFQRLIMSNEVGMKASFDANVIKKMSGADTLVARSLYKEEQSFDVQFTMFIYANDIPEFIPYDDGVQNRFRGVILPNIFVNKIQSKCFIYEKPADENIKELCKEQWFKQGLRYLTLVEGWNYHIKNPNFVPDTIRSNTLELDDNNFKKLLLSEYEITHNPNHFISTNDIAKFNRRYAIIMSPIKIKQELELLGITKSKNQYSFEENGRKKKYRAWLGIRLIPCDSTDNQESINNDQESINNQGSINNQESINNNQNQEFINNNQDSINNPEFINNQDSINNPEFINNQDSINNQEFINNNQESINNTQESINNTQESINNTQEFINNNQESINNNQEFININQESININQESISNNQESINNNQGSINNNYKKNKNNNRKTRKYNQLGINNKHICLL